MMEEANSTWPYLPISLNNEWPLVFRVIFVSVTSLSGLFFNTCFIASFSADKYVQKHGNVYVCGLAGLDMINPGLVEPITLMVMCVCVDPLFICKVQQLLVQASAYGYSLMSMLLGLETYFRLGRYRKQCKRFLVLNAQMFMVMIVFISVVVASVGVYYELDIDYCKRQHSGNKMFRIVTLIFMHFIPCVVSFLGLFFGYISIKSRAVGKTQYHSSKRYIRDFYTNTLNICILLLFICAWLPSVIIIYEYPYASDKIFYLTLWIAVARSSISWLIYILFHKKFRRAFVRIFFYLFLQQPMTIRNRVERERPNLNLATHVFPHAMVPRVPQRNALTSSTTL